MSTATLPAPAGVPTSSDSLFRRLLKRLDFATVAEEWSRSVSGLADWEAEWLLVDNPSPEAVAQHKSMLERLIAFGQLCAFMASFPEFDDVETVEKIHSTQLVLNDKLRMWHGCRMSSEMSDRVLRGVS